MDLEFIERLIEVFGRSPAIELELARDGWRVRLAKSKFVSADLGPGGDELPPDAVATELSASIDKIEGASTLPAVVAGLVGTFYRRPAPDQPVFVEVGDVVEEGRTLGIIEAMKTLIPVEADRAGRIREIFCQDGASVEPGDVLFTVGAVDRP